jgi:uncharacterized protein (DUF1499 family)
MWKRIVVIAFVVGVIIVAASLGLIIVLSVMSQFPPGNLGVDNGKLKPCPDSPNCVSSQATDEEHKAEPLRFRDHGPLPAGEPALPQYSSDEAWARLVVVVAGMPRTDVVAADEAYMHVEFRSAVFRFVDDVEFVLDADNKVIHFRSASRVGRSDLGANRKRMEAIRAAWEKEAR